MISTLITEWLLVNWISRDHLGLEFWLLVGPTKTLIRINLDKTYQKHFQDLITHDYKISAENYNKTLSDVYNDHFPLQTRW